MSTQQEEAQPSQATIITVQTQELDRLSSNRIYLMALLEDAKTQFAQELTTRDEHINSLTAEVARLQAELEMPTVVDTQA